jgi:hypothetical protein
LLPKNDEIPLQWHGLHAVAGKWVRFIIFDVFRHFVLPCNTDFAGDSTL